MEPLAPTKAGPATQGKPWHGSPHWNTCSAKPVPGRKGLEITVQTKTQAAAGSHRPHPHHGNTHDALHAARPHILGMCKMQPSIARRKGTFMQEMPWSATSWGRHLQISPTGAATTAKSGTSRCSSTTATRTGCPMEGRKAREGADTPSYSESSAQTDATDATNYRGGTRSRKGTAGTCGEATTTRPESAPPQCLQSLWELQTTIQAGNTCQRAHPSSRT